MAMLRRWVQAAKDLFLIVIGALLTALALDWFLVPNRIAAGGVSGLATIIYHWTGLPVGALSLAFNLPLLILAVVVLGWQSAVKTVIGAVLVSVFTDALVLLVQPLTHDPLLAAVSGGLLAGVGLGLCFRSGGSTGGTDIAAQLLQRRSRRQGVGAYLLIADGFVLLLAGIAFTPELALYALVALLASSVVIDVVLEGLPYARQALIVTEPEQARQISEEVFKRLGRGVTALSGQGMYTQAERCILLVVVVRGELRTLTDLVADIDPDAFVVISDVRSVLGEGFEESERLRRLRRAARP
jgi:uncharacterized membrane-anchored protein YitT (DUF2179 family)